jgi:uncharacterized protein YbjT (DUF2867 family)
MEDFMNKKRTYAVLGASGHIGYVLSEKLLSEGHEVRGVARSSDHLKNLVQKGGKPYAAAFTDAAALAKGLEGVDGAFTMIPPDMMGSDYRHFQKEAGEAIVQALQKTSVKHVVNLSSVGGHLSEKTGVILGLHYQEERMNQMPAVNIVHLRPAFFMENLLFMIDVIRTQGIAGGALRANLKIPMIATRDIASRAAELLVGLDFQGKSTMELLGERDLSFEEITPILGRAIGKPDLKYVQFPYDAVEGAMLKMGMPANTVSLMIEMYRSFNEGFIKPTEARSKRNTTPTSIEEFAKTFAVMYQQSMK